MLCEKCQSNEATMHLTHFANGRGATLHLCADCARKLGLSVFPPPFLANMEEFVERLMRLGATPLSPSDAAPAPLPAPSSSAPDAVCPSCGASLAQMAETDSAGCPDCLLSFLANSPRATEAYLGKFPASLPPADRSRILSRRLRDRLRRAVRAERYEEAAALRNALAALPGATTGDVP